MPSTSGCTVRSHVTGPAQRRSRSRSWHCRHCLAPRPPPVRALRQLALAFGMGVALATPLLGCDKPPDATREWTPKDHDRADESGKLAAGAQAAQRPKREGNADPTSQLAELADTAWQAQCAVCHGALGRGDGPNGPLVHATDLTAASWLKSVSDSDIGQAIKNGKGRMPKFDLPDTVIAALTARIRAIGAASASSVNAPNGSAPAPSAGGASLAAPPAPGSAHARLAAPNNAGTGATSRPPTAAAAPSK